MVVLDDQLELLIVNKGCVSLDLRGEEPQHVFVFLESSEEEPFCGCDGHFAGLVLLGGERDEYFAFFDFFDSLLHLLVHIFAVGAAEFLLFGDIIDIRVVSLFFVFHEARFWVIFKFRIFPVSLEADSSDVCTQNIKGQRV